MQTYSHLLITALTGKTIKPNRFPLHQKALLLGAVLPDIPLFALTALYGAYYRWVNPLPAGEIHELLHDDYFFNNPVWIVSHNLFHAPLIIALLLLAGWAADRRGKGFGRVLFSLAAGLALHSLVDIFTHAGDGPLLFFPFDWTYRFRSGVSYWDPQHYGRIFFWGEHILDLMLVGYFLWLWLKNKRRLVLHAAR